MNKHPSNSNLFVFFFFLIFLIDCESRYVTELIINLTDSDFSTGCYQTYFTIQGETEPPFQFLHPINDGKYINVDIPFLITYINGEHMTDTETNEFFNDDCSNVYIHDEDSGDNDDIIEIWVESGCSTKSNGGDIETGTNGRSIMVWFRIKELEIGGKKRYEIFIGDKCGNENELAALGRVLKNEDLEFMMMVDESTGVCPDGWEKFLGIVNKALIGAIDDGQVEGCINGEIPTEYTHNHNNARMFDVSATSCSDSQDTNVGTGYQIGAEFGHHTKYSEEHLSQNTVTTTSDVTKNNLPPSTGYTFCKRSEYFVEPDSLLITSSDPVDMTFDTEDGVIDLTYLHPGTFFAGAGDVTEIGNYMGPSVFPHTHDFGGEFVITDEGIDIDYMTDGSILNMDDHKHIFSGISTLSKPTTTEVLDSFLPPYRTVGVVRYTGDGKHLYEFSNIMSDIVVIASKIPPMGYAKREIFNGRGPILKGDGVAESIHEIVGIDSSHDSIVRHIHEFSVSVGAQDGNSNRASVHVDQMFYNEICEEYHSHLFKGKIFGVVEVDVYSLCPLYLLRRKDPINNIIKVEIISKAENEREKLVNFLKNPIFIVSTSVGVGVIILVVVIVVCCYLLLY